MTWIYHGTPELDADSTYLTGLIVCIVVPVLMTAVVGLRVYTRLRIVCKVGADDILTISAAVFATIYAALWISQTRLGLGLPPVDRPPQNLHEYGRQNYAGRPIYVLSTISFKLALCISYLRFTRGTNRSGTRLAIWICLVFTVLYNTAWILMLLFACNPVAASWNSSIDGKCLPLDPFYYSTGLLEMLNDLVLFILPIPLIWRMEWSMRTKLGLSIMFLFSLLTTFCSIMRTVAINDIHRTGDAANFILWGVIEACVGTMTSSIPALRPLLQNVKKRVRGRVHGSGQIHTATPVRKVHPQNNIVSSLPGDSTIDSGQDSAFTESQLTEHSDGSEDDILPNDWSDSSSGGFVERLTIAITRTTDIRISYKTASRGSPEVTTQKSEQNLEGATKQAGQR